MQSNGQSIYIPYLCLQPNDNNEGLIAFESNPAILAKHKYTQSGIFAENKFLIKELAVINAWFIYPAKQMSFGISCNRFGNDLYNRYNVKLGFAKHLSDNIHVGIACNYSNTQISSCFFSAHLSGDVSTIVDVSSMSFFAGINNLFSSDFKKEHSNEKPFELHMGCEYRASDNFSLNVLCFKTEDCPINYIAGFQYQYTKLFFIKFGTISETNSFFGGLAFSWRNYRLDFSATFHPVLGMSPGFGISTTGVSKTNH